jgi:integrase
MARNVIDTPAKRRTLPASRSAYWRPVSRGIALGFRKLSDEAPGSWLGRVMSDGRRAERALGPVDNGDGTESGLTYEAALLALTEWAGTARAGLKAEAVGASREAGTVRSLVAAYVAERIARDPKNGKDAKSRLTRHVLSADNIANKRVAALTEADWKTWRAGLVKVQRGKKQMVAGAQPLEPSTVARLLNDLKAALGDNLPLPARKTLKAPALAHKSRDNIVLPDADIRRVIEAAYSQDEDFGALVLVLAATGARFSQVAGLRVRDVQIDKARLMVPRSAKGKKTNAAPIAVPIGDDVLARLKPFVNGRKGHEVLLNRWRMKQTGPIEWERNTRGPWAAAAEMRRPWLKALTAAGLAPIEAYSLRHSSIVRALQAGLPVRLTAALHDTSIQMIEKNYAAYIVDQSEELVRRALTPLADTSAKIVSISEAKRVS